MFTGSIKVTDEIVKAKLRLAGPHILEHNRQLVGEMIGYVRDLTKAETPLGLGRRGYHLRDSYRIEVKSSGVLTVGKLLAPMQGYWREFGHRKGRTGGVEAPRRTAHKAAALARKIINTYYGGMARWWKL